MATQLVKNGPRLPSGRYFGRSVRLNKGEIHRPASRLAHDGHASAPSDTLPRLFTAGCIEFSEQLSHVTII